MPGTYRRTSTCASSLRSFPSHTQIRSLILALTFATLLTLAFGTSSALAAFPDSEQAERVIARESGEVAEKEWASYPFDVRGGVTYLIQLQATHADADLYLNLGATRVAKSITEGLALETLLWTAPRNGVGRIWIHGHGGATSFAFAVTELGDSVQSPAPTFASKPIPAPVPAPVPSPVAAPVPEPERPSVAVASRSGRTYRVGLQVGHLRSWELGGQLARQTGGVWGTLTEPGVNQIIVRYTVELLEAAGHQVDVLPALIPKGYKADVFVSVHSDSGPSNRRGFFSDRAVRSNKAAVDDRLVRALNTEYAAATGLPYVYRGTEGTKYYYGYSAVSPTTPMALIENGFLTNAADRTIIVSQPERAARGIFNAIQRFLGE